MKFDLTIVEEIRKGLNALPDKEKKSFGRTSDVLSELASELRTLKGKGYSDADLAALLTEKGVPTTRASVAYALKKTAKRNGPKKKPSDAGTARQASRTKETP
jgi:hypothetical protein